MIVVLSVIAGFVLIFLIWFIVLYNRLASVRQHLKESWSDIDVELKRRYDLVPNLVETVKGYAAHEQDVFDSVTKARTAAMANHGSPASQGHDEVMLQSGIKRLFAVAEQYPDLKASENFLHLQSELANTEDRIAASRRFFNANTREMNQLCTTIPTNIVAGMFGFHQGDFFELDDESERVVPRV